MVQEDKSYSIDYLDSEKRAITNSLQVYFKDGSFSEKMVIEYPVGHKRRRSEGLPLLIQKFKSAGLSPELEGFCLNREKFEATSVTQLLDLIYNEWESVLGSRY